MAYVLEPIAHDDLPRILADAKSDPKIDEAIQKEFQDGIPPHREWVIDRANDSYLFGSAELSDSKASRAGCLFFFRGKVSVVYLCTSDFVYGKSSHVPGGMEGWVSLARDFSAPLPEDPDFQRAFSEAYDALWKGHPGTKLVFRVDLTNPYARERITNDDLPKILADAKTNPEIDRFIQVGFRNGAKTNFEVSLTDTWAIDRENDSYLFRSRGFGNSKVSCEGFMFFYRGKAFAVCMHTSNHVHGKSRQRYVPEGMAGWVSLSRDFSTPPPQDPDFQRAFSEAYDVLRKGRLPKPIFGKGQQDQELSK
jgi:hypothetical protein